MPVSEVRNGIDNIGRYSGLFKGRRLGLITNHTGLDKTFRSTVDVIRGNYDLRALYAPEHGLRGCLQAGMTVGSYVDERTGLPVYSLYGEQKKPAPDMLADIDVLVYDIQDIGSRYYTYIYTMALAMESCAENGKTFVVLDRINPIGEGIEGNLPDMRFKSFVGLYPIPVRYGLTAGELACLLNDEFGIRAHLEIVETEGWKRRDGFHGTDLHWVDPTPNMTSPDAALLYCGTCLLEGTNISEGRGTTRPFEIAGAPWIDPYGLSDAMNAKGLGGIHFRPVYFEPVFSKHCNIICGGVRLHITDRYAFKPFECGVMLLAEIREMYPEQFSWIPQTDANDKYFIDLLAGTDELRLSGSRCETVRLLEKWRQECECFEPIRRKYMLYE